MRAIDAEAFARSPSICGLGKTAADRWGAPRDVFMNVGITGVVADGFAPAPDHVGELIILRGWACATETDDVVFTGARPDGCDPAP